MTDPEWFKKDDGAPQDGGVLRIEQEVRESLMTPDEIRELEQAQEQDRLGELVTWWVRTAERDARTTLPKAVEYGSQDLAMMGAMLVAGGASQWAGADAGDRDRAGMEMAVLFYLHGKIARAISAMQAGRWGSDDTLFDITVYSVMLRRIRETGSWV